MSKVAAILDIDGTLVDSSYHHTMAWHRAFRQHDAPVPVWKSHRHIGMGGDHLITAAAGKKVEKDKGDDIRAAHDALYLAMLDEIDPLPGAIDLITTFKQRGHTVVLASSAKANEADYYIDLLKVRDVIDGWTTSADVEATKPEPDLVHAALAKARTSEAVMIGDSVWDCVAAKKAGIPTIGILTGGFSEAELREAGAVAVYESLPELLEHLDETPLAE